MIASSRGEKEGALVAPSSDRTSDFGCPGHRSLLPVSLYITIFVLLYDTSSESDLLIRRCVFPAHLRDSLLFISLHARR